MAKVAVQLFTLRDQLQNDFLGTLEQVSKIGYSAVELFGMDGGLSPVQLGRELANLGLTPVSRHVGLDLLEGDLNAVVQQAKEIGYSYVMCPFLPPDRRGSGENFTKLVDTLNRAGKACADAGLQFGYHNHDFEFQKDGDTYLLDKLFAQTDADKVQAELDLYWIHRAGENPVSYIRKYAGRCDLLHFKDAAKEDGSFAEVGQGVLDWNEIVDAAKSAGAKWYIVEQDVCKGNPLDSIRTSLSFVSQYV